MTGKKENFWIWSPYSTVRGMAFVTELSGLTAGHRQKLYSGKKISPQPRVVVEGFKAGKFYDQLGAYTGVVMLVSDVLREVLEAAEGARLQFIPVTVSGKQDLKYFVVNVLDTLPAIDLDQSKYDAYPDGDIRRIDKLVLRSIPADAPPIFRAAEKTALILVNDELHSRLAAASKHPGVLVAAAKYKNEF